MQVLAAFIKKIKPKLTPLNVAQFLCVAGLLVFIIVTLSSGCTRDISISDIKQNVSGFENINELNESEPSEILKIFGTSFENCVYYKASDIMDVRELLIIKTSSDEEMEAAEKAIDLRLNTQLDNFEGYGAEQVFLLNQSICEKCGQYIFYAVGNEAQSWRNSFLKLIK